MRARVEIENNGKTVSDQLWKDRKQFAENSTRGFFAEKVRLTIELESAADCVALIDWCNQAHISFGK